MHGSLAHILVPRRVLLLMLQAAVHVNDAVLPLCLL
jgi:hypothetical protein